MFPCIKIVSEYIAFSVIIWNEVLENDDDFTDMAQRKKKKKGTT